MDSITQAVLGGLCGELILSKKIGWKGAAWGLFFGTLPDLDVIGFAWQSYAEQLTSHRGLSHSLFIMPLAAIIFGWLLSKIHRKKKLTFTRAAWFVFAALITHSLIDCFNTYGTQIFEPFSSYRFSLDNLFIIDLFFTAPILAFLITRNFIFRQPRKHRKKRKILGILTLSWLCFYVSASFGMKYLSKKHFYSRLHHQGIEVLEMRTAPTLSNIFLWRMVARDKNNYYIGYWSLFDEPERSYPFVQFAQGRELEEKLKDSTDFQTVKWFCGNWRKTYTVASEPDVVYVCGLMIGEVHLPKEHGFLFKPAFIWRFKKQDTATGDHYILDGRFKMSKDGYGTIGSILTPMLKRITGGEPSWMIGSWIWDEKNKNQTQIKKN